MLDVSASVCNIVSLSFKALPSPLVPLLQVASYVFVLLGGFHAALPWWFNRPSNGAGSLLLLVGFHMGLPW